MSAVELLVIVALVVAFVVVFLFLMEPWHWRETWRRAKAAHERNMEYARKHRIDGS